MTDLLFSKAKEYKKYKNKEIKKVNFWTEEEDKILKKKQKNLILKIGNQLQILFLEKILFNAQQDLDV